MRRMFESATLKLTAWYLVILVSISLLFSFIIYELSTTEISSRLERLQIRIEGSSETLTLPGPLTLTDVRMNQTREAQASIFVGLVYMNLAVIGLGGVGSYLLARRTLQPIRASHEAQSRFTSDASHELRTPLAVMKSEIQVALRDPKASKQDYKELLQSNLEEVDKLTALSTTLLELARLDNPNLSRGQYVDVAKIVTKQVEARSDQKHRISVTLPKSPVFVEGNETMLSDLVQILIDNALKYSPPDSEVTLSFGTNGRTCKLFVTNQGEGIDPQDAEHIFDRFYRADSARTSEGGQRSYGIGLSLAKKIVELHEGKISVTSTPRELTLFTVSLPQIRKKR